jgi:hypothetical protein
MAFVSMEAQLSQLEKTVKEMNNFLCTLVLEIRQRNLTISPAPLPHTHTAVTSILPLDIVLSPELTVNLVLSHKMFNLQWHHQQTPQFVTHQQSHQIFQPKLFTIAPAPIGI